MKEEGSLSAEEVESLTKVFKDKLVNQDISVKFEKLKNTKTTAIINMDEFMRRMSEMSEFYGMSESDLLKNATLIVNANSPIVQNLPTLTEEKQELIINQIYYLAMIAYKKLTSEELSDFNERNLKILDVLSK